MRQVVLELENHERRISNLETQDVSPGFFNLHSTYLSLPMLRLYYPLNKYASTSNTLDESGNNLDGIGVGTVQISERFTTFGSNSYIVAASGAEINITGTETYVASGFKGLTWGLWFNPFSAPASETGLFGKYQVTVGNRQYALNCTTGLQPKVLVSVDGNSTSAEATSSVVMETGDWYFITGRFIPSTNLGIFVNGVWTYDTTSIPASVNTSNTALLIPGYYNNFSVPQVTRGSVAHAFICAAALSDTMIMNLFNRTRHLYGA